jgi:hypothetical protein
VQELITTEKIMLGEGKLLQLFRYELQNDPNEFLERLLFYLIPLPQRFPNGRLMPGCRNPEQLLDVFCFSYMKFSRDVNNHLPEEPIGDMERRSVVTAGLPDSGSTAAQ